MPAQHAAVRYRCPCGAEYLVATETPGDPSWLENVRTAATRLHLGVIDGTQSTFVCAECGRTHAQNETGEVPG